MGVPDMAETESPPQWSGLLLVLGGLALITAFEAAFAQDYAMLVFLVFSGSLLVIGGLRMRRRFERNPSTVQPKAK